MAVDALLIARTEYLSAERIYISKFQYFTGTFIVLSIVHRASIAPEDCYTYLYDNGVTVQIS